MTDTYTTEKHKHEISVLRPSLELPVGALCHESPACQTGICGRCPGQTFNTCMEGIASQFLRAACSQSNPGTVGSILAKPYRMLFLLL